LGGKATPRELGYAEIRAGLPAKIQEAHGVFYVQTIENPVSHHDYDLPGLFVFIY